jgi:hypothetical protein
MLTNYSGSTGTLIIRFATVWTEFFTDTIIHWFVAAYTEFYIDKFFAWSTSTRIAHLSALSVLAIETTQFYVWVVRRSSRNILIIEQPIS